MSSEPQPVQGEPVPVSAMKSVWIIGLALGIVPIGLGLIWLWWAETTIPLINKQVAWWGAAIGGFLVVVGVLGPPVILWQWLVRKERLVFGTEYLQVVISKGGRDAVKTQIAYRNIESVSVQKHFENKVVAIQLRDVDAPDLFPAGGEPLVKFKSEFGFHCHLDDSYRMPPEEICRRITTALAV